MPTVLITGANRGLGLAFAQAYAMRGWRIIAAIRGPLEGPLADLVAAHPDTMEAVPLDLGDFATIDALGARLHGVAIDFLIGNAALTGGPLGVFGQTDYDRFAQCLKINTMAPFRLAEVLAANVAASDRRVMFFIGSRLGAHPFFGYSGYIVSKTALNQVVKQAAMALAPQGITVATCHPGWVGTEATAEHGLAPLTPAMSAQMLMAIIDDLTIADTGTFFDPDGSTLPLVTQQTEQRFYGKPKGATR
jgi:NAD(P)-dependent dehydrogenase (short-subunit alcohol dehydrogenase family)